MDFADDIVLCIPRTIEPDHVEALRKSPVLSEVSVPNIERLLEVADSRVLHPGDFLFKEGELTSRLYLVKEGALQILRPDPETGQPRAVVYMKRGDVLCDVGMFTGIRHRSSAQAVETTEVLTIDAADVKTLFKTHHHLASQFAAGLAHALTATRTLLEGSKGTSMTLKGSLKGVDILGIIHSIASCEDVVGHIVIHDDRHTTLGEVTVKNGHVMAASMGELIGDDAFYDLMLSAPSTGGFRFREAGSETRNGEERDDAITTPTANLVLEATRLRDELERFRSLYGAPEIRVRPTTEDDPSFEGPDLGIALKVWGDLQSGRAPAEMVQSTSALTEVRTYGVLHWLIEHGKATLDASTTP